MSESAIALTETKKPRLNPAWVVLGLALCLILARPYLPEGLMRPAEFLILPLADWINALFTWLRDDLGLIHVTRAFAAGIEWLLDVTANILYGKNRLSRLVPDFN